MPKGGKDMATTKVINKHELAAQGENLYAPLKAKLEREHRGEFAAIEVESGDYFLGKTLQEADKKARVKYPNRVFYVVRMGRRAVWVRR